MTGNTSQNKALEGRDAKTGRFVSGNNGGGRPKGSRNKLAAEFIDALYADFQQNGAEAIKRVASDEPAKYLTLIAQILPKELDVALNVNSDLFAEARDFAAAYKLALSYIGAKTESEGQLMIEADPEPES
jgi:hypothetical protein